MTSEQTLCSDCPPVGYPTDKTRCLPCPRRTSQGAPEAGAWKTVPVEPTDAMVKSGLAAHSIAAGFGEPWEVQIGDIYRAMLAASPSPPPGVGDWQGILARGMPFGFDPATGFFHENDGGAPTSCVFYEPVSDAPPVGVEVVKLREAARLAHDWFANAEIADADFSAAKSIDDLLVAALSSTLVPSPLLKEAEEALTRIAGDFVPDRPQDASLALEEMREAIFALAARLGAAP